MSEHWELENAETTPDLRPPISPVMPLAAILSAIGLVTTLGVLL